MKTLPIIIRSGDASQPGLMHLRAFTPRQRVFRASIIWALMWFLALLTAPVCGLHLVSVPFFLIAGPFFGYRRYQLTEAPDHATGICPAHNQDFTLPLDSTDRLPLSARCPICNASLLLFTPDPTPTPSHSPGNSSIRTQ